MFRGIRDLSKFFRGIQFLKKSGNNRGITYSYSDSDSIFLERRQVENEWKRVENEWNDDEHEQRQIFDEKEKEKEKEKEIFKCEITNKPVTIDCNCEFGCMAKMSESFLIHYEGGVGIISKK